MNRGRGNSYFGRDSSLYGLTQNIVYVTFGKKGFGLPVIGTKMDKRRRRWGEDGNQSREVSGRRSFPNENMHPCPEFFFGLGKRCALVIGFGAGANVGPKVRAGKARSMAIDRPTLGRPKFCQKVRIPGQNAGEIHDLS
jgi:hypothetical protein